MSSISHTKHATEQALRKMNLSAEKILIISSKFPPNGSVGSLRLYNFATEAGKFFKTVHVIHPANPAIRLVEDFPPLKAEMHAVYNFDYRNVITLTKKGKTAGSGFNPDSLSSRLVNSFPLNIYIGEAALNFKKSSLVLAKRLIEQEKIRFVFSSFRPFADHFVCYRLKQAFPELIWIADFRDYHFIQKNMALWPRVQEKWKKKILSQADVLTAVSESITQEFSTYSQNSYTLRNAIGQQFQISEREDTNSKFRILYSGSIYPEYQKVDLFFECLKELMDSNSIQEEQIEFVYCGPHSSYFRDAFKAAGLSNIFIDKGIVSYQQANLLQQSSHINLLLSWNHPEGKGILTAKLYDYLAACRPIVALVNGTKEEELEEILNDYGSGVVFYPNEGCNTELKAFVLAIYLSWEKGQSVNSQLSFESTYSKFGWEKNFSEFASFLCTMKSENP